MEYKLQDLIDIEQFQDLQNRLNGIYSFPSAIIDNEGNILTATAWQDVCTKFHRMNKETEKECVKSDQYILSHLHEANPAVSYRCPHGLVDNATPIIIDGVHYGNFFTGQFFLEKPDLAFFKEQAKKYGFDEEVYLEAVKKVPIWSKEQLNSYLFFIKGLIDVISSSGLKKLKEVEARKKIEETEERASVIMNQMMDGFWITSGGKGQVIDVNPAMCEMLGYTSEELLTMTVADVEAIDSPEDIQQRIKQIIRNGSANFQSRHRRKDGTIIDVDVSVTHIPSSNLFFAIHHDITEQKQSNERLRESEERFHQMFEKHNAVMLLIEPDSGNIIDANIAAQDYYGYPIEKLKQMKIQDINTLPMEEVAKRLKQASIESLNFFVFPHRLASGEIRTVEVHSSPISVQGKLILFSVIHDVTEKKQADQKIQEHLMRLDALIKIDQAISSSFDLNISLNILLSYAVRLLNVDATTVLQFNPELNILEYIAGLGFKTEAVKKSSVRIGESYAGKVALEQHLVQVQNLADEPDNLFTQGFLKEEDFVSYYGMPLIVKGKLIGVLEAFSRSNIERNREWLDFFNALAGQAAIAMDNLTLFNELERSNFELLMAYDATIEGWSRAMDMRDEETEGHTRRVTDMTVKLAEKTGVNPDEFVHIRRGTLLHDIGKLGVPDHILRKPGNLTEDEWEIMRQHPNYAYNMLKRIAYLQPAIDIPYCHHEKWDGTGYPRGLKGEQIPLSARIFAIIDVWDALTNDRSYRPAWSREKTLEYIRSQAGAHFDPDVVEVFLELIKNE